MKHHRPDDPIDWRTDPEALAAYGEHLIRSAIDEASDWLTGEEIENLFDKEMERRYGKKTRSLAS